MNSLVAPPSSVAEAGLPALAGRERRSPLPWRVHSYARSLIALGFGVALHLVYLGLGAFFLYAAAALWWRG